VTTNRQRPPRPRYARMVLAASALTVTAVSMLGGLGTLPTAANADVPRRATVQAGEVTAAPSSATAPATNGPAGGLTALDSTIADVTLPGDAGEGRRVVFSEGRQRVWLVGEGDVVERTYLVSGSVYDNLDLGTFEVYSRSEQALGIEDSGSMRWFVRFAYGDTGAAIGFHDIPVDEGAKVQTPAELGTPTSHGCVRQRTRDALAIWEFAPVGTTVVVTT